MSILDFLFGGGSNNSSNTYGPVQYPPAGSMGYHGTAEGNSPNIGTGGGNLSSLAQIIPAIIASFKGINTGGQKRTTEQLENVTNAMYNTNNPLYQQLYGQNRQLQQQNLGNAISQAEGHNRMLSAAGRTPLFANGREGETAFRSMVQGQDNAAQLAQQQTQGQLGNAADTLARGLYPIQQHNSENSFANTALGLGGYNSIADLLRRGGL